MQQSLNRRIVVRLLLILFVTTTISAVHYLVESPHIIDIKRSKQDSPDNVIVYGLTKKNHLTDIEFPSFFKKLLVATDTAHFKHFSLTIEGEKVQVEKKDLISLDLRDVKNKLPNAKLYEIKNILVNNSNLPFLNQFINWKCDGSFFKKIFFNSLQLSIWGIIGLLFLLRPFFVKREWKSFVTESHNDRKRFYLVAISFFLLLFSVLLLINPYYFLREDVYAQFQPVINFSLEQWYQKGSVPTYNPYQFAGVPTAPQSIYSLFYPGTHIAFVISKYILQNTHHFNTVYAFLHLLIGYIFLLKFFRRIGINSFITICFSLSFVFSGVVLFWVSNWYYVLPTVALLPIIAYCNTIEFKKIHNYFLVHLLLFVLYFYSGNVQFFLYSFCFWIGYLLIAGQKKLTIKYTLLFVVLLMLCCLPQLAVSMAYLKNVYREPFLGGSTFNEFSNFLFPFKNIADKNSTSPLYEQGYFYSFYNVVYFAVPVALSICVAYYLRIVKQVSKTLTFLCVSFIISVIFFLGKSGLLWSLFSNLPFFKYFHHPVKFALYIIFFGLVLVVLLLQYYFNNSSVNTRKTANVLIGVMTMVPLATSFYFNQIEFNRYGYQKPYQNPQWLNKIELNHQYRIAALSDSTYVNQSGTMLFNFPTEFRMPAITGLEVLSDVYPDMVNHSKEYGVKYYIISKLKNYQSGVTSYCHTPLIDSIERNTTKIYANDEMAIYEDKNAEPMVQCFSDSVRINAAFRIAYRNDGFDVHFDQLQSTTTKLILAFCNRPGMVASIDGKEVAIQTDAFKRMRLYPANPFSKISIRYKPMRFIGF